MKTLIVLLLFSANALADDFRHNNWGDMRDLGALRIGSSPFTQPRKVADEDSKTESTVKYNGAEDRANPTTSISEISGSSDDSSTESVTNK